jgi:KUP system potassium uptake protein
LTPNSSADRPLTAAGLVGVLGVVYGDIGTSPLYALRASLLHFSSDGIERWEILGVLSLIFWALVLTVSLKYVAFVLRADNRGEGGILALMALAQRQARTERGRWIVALVGIVGAALFFGDGIITPAISVLSAVEGLKVISPHFEEAVVPIALGILLGLFLIQYRGTGSMGAIFGPVCALWFAILGVLGLVEIVQEPGVLVALSPHYAIQFCLYYQLAAFIAFGSSCWR